MAKEAVIITLSSDEESDETDNEDARSFAENAANIPAEVERTSFEIKRRLQWGQHNINSGCLHELPLIAIDKFHGDTLSAKIFFLTHLHTDHMVGLEFSPFLKRLHEPGIKLYTSSATPMLFPIFSGSGYLGGPENMHKLIREEKLIPLDVNQRIQLDYRGKTTRDHKQVYVTMIPAGHCPGSVMLLFEYDKERILYTGDFRLSIEEIKKLSSCYYQSEEEYLKDYPERKNSTAEFKTKLKRISHLYLDTTFCSNIENTNVNSSSNLVSRDGAIERVLPRIKDHLQTTGNVIQLEFSARVSHEYVIVQFKKLLNEKTHVSPKIFKIYSEIDSCVESMTLDPKAAIHLCKRTEKCISGKNVLKVKLSAMWFTMGNGSTTVRERGNFVNVCYSMHASLKEMGALIELFDVQVVTPLVLPRDLPRRQIESSLRSVTSHNFTYKDYENEPEHEVLSSSQETNSQQSSSSSEYPILNDSQVSISPKLDSLELFENEYFVPCKRSKLEWSRSKTPPPSKM